MKKNYFILLLSFILFSTQIFAQPKKKIKFGKVSKEDLEMTVYDKDSSAVAVILSDVGESRYIFPTGKMNVDKPKDFTLEFERHVRIKILKEEGKKWADWKILYYEAKNGKEDFTKLKAFTFKLKDGKINKVKMRKNMVFDKEMNKYYNNKIFTMPDVQVGDIIDIKYIISTEMINLLKKWKFQHSIPTIYSQYSTFIPEYFDISPISKGYHHINTEKEVHFRNAKIIFEKKAQGSQEGYSYTKEYDYREKETVYYAEHIPAIKNENFLSSVDNYISSVDFDIKTIKYPYGMVYDYTTNWFSVDNSLLKHSQFGQQLKKKNFIAKIIPSIIGDAKTNEEKALKIYNHVKERMTWNNKNGVYCEFGIKNAYNERIGNSADINLLLIAMLRQAKVEAYPIVLSTRSNGFLSTTHASIDKLNYVIAAVVNGNNYDLYDAIDGIPNLLPLKCLNGDARLVDEKFSRWINLIPNYYSTQKDIYSLKLNKDGIIEGSNKTTYQAYTYWDFFNKKRKTNSHKELIEKIEGDLESFSISELKIDSINPMINTKKFTLNNNVAISGDLMYFSPIILNGVGKNPFKKEDRIFPVDFIFPRNYNVIMSYEIPENYKVEEIPKAVSYSTADRSLSYVYSVNTIGNKISVVSNFKISQTIFLPTKYKEIKNFFAQMITKQAENIVLKKITK